MLYLQSLNLFYVGRLTDDARHLLAARSLLQGRYVDLSRPEEPPLLNQLPGYPLLLLPVAASPRAAQVLNIFLLLAACAVLLRLFQEEGGAGSWAVVLTALSPLAVVSATTVMTEAPYLFFTAWAFLELKEGRDNPHPSPLLFKERGFISALSEARKQFSLSLKGRGRGEDWRVIGLAFLLGFTVWIHPQGAAALLAAAVLLIERRRPHFVPILLGAGVVAGLPFLYNTIVTGIPASYFLEGPGHSGGVAAVVSVVGANLLRWPMLLSEAMFHWMDPLPGADSWPARLLAVSALALIGLEMARRRSALDRIAQVYCFLFVGLHLFWSNQLHRYVFPLLPFLFLFLLRPFFRAGAAGPRLAGFLAGVFIFLDLTLVVNAQRLRPGDNAPPSAWEWIRANTAASDLLVAGRPEPLFLYTRRKAARLYWVDDPDAWLGGLLERGVRLFVADHPERDLPPAAAAHREPLVSALTALARRMEDPERFIPLYQDEEGTGVYTVRDPERFLAGWGLLKQAKEEISAGRLDVALGLLEKAKAEKAPLVRLPFFHGTTLMLLGRPKEARPLLQEAARREPGFAAAQSNLDRIGAR